MDVDSTYAHVLQGRLRIKVAGVKGSPEGAARVEAHLASIDGVFAVAANPMTGSVLVHYDPAAVRQGDIVEALRALGCLPYPTGDLPPRGKLLLRLAGAVAQAATEAALQQALGALGSLTTISPWGPRC
jgi:copper chaperone CopZ